MRLAHSEIPRMTLVAAARLGVVDVTAVDKCSGQFCDAILGTEGLAVTSSGYSLESLSVSEGARRVKALSDIM